MLLSMLSTSEGMTGCVGFDEDVYHLRTQLSSPETVMRDTVCLYEDVH